MLGRKSSISRRVRRQDEQLDVKPSPFLYRSRRADETANIGRKEERQDSGSRFSFLLQRVCLVVLALAIIFSLTNVLSLSGQAKVEPLISNENRSFLRDSRKYSSASDKLLAGSIWNRNKITIDTNNISQKLLAQFPELSSVSITVPLVSHRPIVYIQPAEPALILKNEKGNYVVTDSGKTLLPADNLADFNNLNLPVVEDHSGLTPNVGKAVLPEPSVNFIKVVAFQMKTKNIPLASMSLPPASDELDVQPAGQAYLVKFNLASDKALEQVGTYIASINSLKEQHITPSHYIDVRVAGKAYYN